jgi:hypothetical protein
MDYICQFLLHTEEVIERRGNLVALLIIFCLPLILFWKLVFGGKVLYWGLPILQFYPWRNLAVEMIREGEIPLWNHYLGNGTPLAANLQSAVFYPLNFFYLFFPTERALGYSAILHIALAGLFMYAFSRTIKLSRFASLISAISFMLSGFLISRLHFISIISSFPWLALLFCFTERLVREPNLRCSLLLGSAIGLQFLAGHAQMWYYSMWAISFYFLYRSWQAANRWRTWASFSISVLSGICLAAVQFLPTLEFFLLSGRAGGVDWEMAMTYSFWPWRLITFFAPDFFGNPAYGDYWGYATYWEDCAYIGVLPMMLALSAIVIWIKRGNTTRSQLPFFLFLSLVSILLAMGKNTPIYPLVFRYVPGFGLFQAPARFLCLYTLAIATLAGIGTDLLGILERRAFRYMIAVGFGFLFASALVKFFIPSVKRTFALSLIKFAILFICSSILLLKKVGRTNESRFLDFIIVLFIAADLIVFGYPLNPVAEPDLYDIPTSIGRFLKKDEELFRIFIFEDAEIEVKFKRYFRFDDFGPVDLSHWWGLREALLPNLGVSEHLYSANNFDPLQVGRHLELIEAINEAPLPEALRLLGLMNVKYIVDVEEIPGLELVYSGRGVRVYRNEAFLPRAYIVPEAHIITDPSELLAELRSPSFDPRREVLLETPAPSFPSSSSVLSLKYFPNGIKVEVILSERGYLFISDTYYPGWRAYVDGEESEVLRANYAFKAVALPPGEHVVVLRYEPLLLKAGAALSLCSVCLIGFILWAHLRRSTRRASYRR